MNLVVGGGGRGEDIGGFFFFRVHADENRLYAYAFSSRAFDAVNKLYPKKFSELSVSMDEYSNLLVKAVQRKEEQESDHLYDFARPALNEMVSAAVQRLVGAKHGIAYPLRLKQGKATGVVLFSVGDQAIDARQRVLLEAFRSQLELAFENVLEFERVVKRYQKSVVPADENKPTAHFMLRITPKQNMLLEQRAKEVGLDKTSYIRSWIDSGAKR